MAFRIDKWKGHGLIDTWILLWQAMLICHLTDVLNIYNMYLYILVLELYVLKYNMYLSICFLQPCNI